MRTKRGLSDVVTTVLIILLVLAAVVIIWTFVRPAIEGGISQVGSECFEMDLKAVDCTFDGASSYTVVVERGPAEIDYEEVLLVFDDDGNNQVSVDSSQTATLANTPAALGRSSHINDVADIGFAPQFVTVTARVRSDAGEVKLCDPTAVRAACA